MEPSGYVYTLRGAKLLDPDCYVVRNRWPLLGDPRVSVCASGRRRGDAAAEDDESKRQKQKVEELDDSVLVFVFSGCACRRGVREDMMCAGMQVRLEIVGLDGGMVLSIIDLKEVR